MEVVPAGKPQSSFRSHHFRLLSLLLNNLGRYNKRIGIYMEFSLAKMRLKDTAIIMNNEARCLPFLIATHKEGRGEKGEKKKGESGTRNRGCERGKTKASIWVDLCKRLFNCRKTPTITKNKKCGLGLFFFFLISGSFVSRKKFKKKLRLKKHKGCGTGPFKAWRGDAEEWVLGEGVCIVC